MKKIILIVIAILIIISSGAYYYFTRTQSPVNQLNIPLTDNSIWKTYLNSEFGFSIKYPPRYEVYESIYDSNKSWRGKTLITILDKENKSTYEFHVQPAVITVNRQPVVFKGKIYHTINEYQQSGIAEQTIFGASNFAGELISINGIQALKFYLSGGDSDSPSDVYYFIKDDLIYVISFNASDPYKNEMLDSIIWY